MSKEKVGKGSQLSAVKGTSGDAPQLIGVLPKDLIHEMGAVFNEFITLNKGEVTGSMARRMNYNMQSIKRNAEAYAKKERDLIKENVECIGEEPLFWDGTNTEDVYAPTLLEDAGKEPVLVSGLVMQRPHNEAPGWAFFNEKGEKLELRHDTKLKYYVKDETKRDWFSKELNDLVNTPVEVSLHLFSNAELDNLKIPTADAVTLERFYNNFGHE